MSTTVREDGTRIGAERGPSSAPWHPPALAVGGDGSSQSRHYGTSPKISINYFLRRHHLFVFSSLQYKTHSRT